MSTSNAETLKQEGMKLFKRGEYDEALAKFEMAAKAYESEEDDLGQAEVLNNEGVVYRVQGQPGLAISALREAETIFARLGASNERGQVLGNLGDLYAANRDRDEAAKCYSESAAIFAEHGDAEKQSQVLRALSLLRLRQGKWLAALMHMEESLKVRPRISLPARLFRSMLRFALALLTRG